MTEQISFLESIDIVKAQNSCVNLTKFIHRERAILL